MYKPARVVLASAAQRENLKSPSNKKYQSIKIDLRDAAPADTLLLTRGQIAKIEKARTLARRKYKTIRMSRKQIEKNRSYQGGLLNDDDAKGKDPSASTTSSIDADVDDGFYLIKRGHCMKVYPIQGNGLYLKTTRPFSSYAVFEDGLYLKRGKNIDKGEEIAFAENGPFKNNPILAWIL